MSIHIQSSPAEGDSIQEAWIKITFAEENGSWQNHD